MKTIPFDLEKFKAGAVAICGDSKCTYVGTYKNGNIAVEYNELNWTLLAITLRDCWSLIADPEYIPLTMNDLLAMPQLPLVRVKNTAFAEAILRVAPGCIYMGTNKLQCTFDWLFRDCEMLVNGKWVPMRKEKV